MKPDEISADTPIDGEEKDTLQEQDSDASGAERDSEGETQGNDQTEELDVIEQLALKSEQERGIVPGESEVPDESEEPEDGVESQDAAPEKVTVIVDGEEQEKTIEELKASFQIQASARNKMTEAAELKKELERQIAEVKELKETLSSQSQTDQTSDFDSGSVDDDLDIDEIVSGIREGTDEEAVEAMATLITNLKQQVQPSMALDEDTVAARALEKFEEKKKEAAMKAEAAELAEAELKFKDTFKADIEADKRFFGFASAEDQLLVDDPEWATKPVLERFKEAGRRARELLKAEQRLRSTRNKQRKKEAQIPRQSGSRATLTDKQQTIPTYTDIVREMQMERGQVL